MKKKLIFLIIAVAVALTIASFVGIKWYNNQEYAIVSKSFDVKISKDADLIYFDEDDTYCHAAYSVDDNNYNSIFLQLQKLGYETTEIDASEEFEWIPTDRIVAAYALDNDTKVFITKAVDGYTELYFVK